MVDKHLVGICREIGDNDRRVKVGCVPCHCLRHRTKEVTEYFHPFICELPDAFYSSPNIFQSLKTRNEIFLMLLSKSVL